MIGEPIEVQGRAFTFCAATIGNPHCVIPVGELSPELARRYGPDLETHPLFPNRTNVQFMRVIDRAQIQIEIWERGAGYTLASGTSSSAAAAVAHRLGLVDKLRWLDVNGPRTIGSHLHDVRGILDHRAPGNGDVEWAYIVAGLPETALRTFEIDQHEPEDLLSPALRYLVDRQVMPR